MSRHALDEPHLLLLVISDRLPENSAIIAADVVPESPTLRLIERVEITSEQKFQLGLVRERAPDIHPGKFVYSFPEF